MEFNNLLVEIAKPIAIVTVNRPKVLNALNLETVGELGAAFSMLEADDSVRAIILTGAGEKAFVAGADITEFRGKTPPEMIPFAKKGHDVARIMESMGKPIIAAVNGYALGGGCEMAMACDLRFASENAKFGQPEILTRSSVNLRYYSVSSRGWVARSASPGSWARASRESLSTVASRSRRRGPTR